MKIKWIGLSCFMLVSDSGVRVITDPFEPHFYGRNYGRINEEADIVTTSHDHADHNYTSAINGDPTVFSQVGKHKSNGISILGIKSYHDAVRGWERGDNIIFCFDIDGMRLCHLGDLGHLPSDEQLTKMGDVNVLIFPAGGRSTLDPADAKIVVDLIKPSIAIPMHFDTGRLTLPYKTGDLLKLWPDISIINSPEVELSREQLLPTTTVMLLKEEL